MVLSISAGEMKSPSVVEVAVQSGAPANIQFRIVLIDLSGQVEVVPSGIRLDRCLVIPRSRLYSSEASGISRHNCSLFR